MISSISCIQWALCVTVLTKRQNQRKLLRAVLRGNILYEIGNAIFVLIFHIWDFYVRFYVGSELCHAQLKIIKEDTCYSDCFNSRILNQTCTRITTNVTVTLVF